MLERKAYAHEVTRIPVVLQVVECRCDCSFSMSGGKVVDIGDGDPDFRVGAPDLRVEKALVFSTEMTLRELKDDLSLQVFERAT